MQYYIPITPAYLGGGVSDTILLLGVLLLTAFLAVTKYRRELRRNNSLVTDDETDPAEDIEEIPLCPGCFAEITEYDRLCPHCSYPVGDFVTIDPIQRYAALAYMTTRGIAHPPLGFLFWPFILFLLARAVYVLAGLGVGGIQDALFLLIGIPFFLLYLYAIYRTFRNGIATQTELDSEESAPPEDPIL